MDTVRYFIGDYFLRATLFDYEYGGGYADAFARYAVERAYFILCLWEKAGGVFIFAFFGGDFVCADNFYLL